MRPRPLQAVAAVAILTLVVAGCGAAPSPTPSERPPSPSVESTPGPVAIADLAHAVVQIVSFVDDSPYASGSGTIISPDGLILTNAHVVTPDTGTLDRLEIGLTEASDTPPEPTFLAEVAAIDGALDLAVLRITEPIDGGEVPDDLPYVELGDSDSLEIGDPLRILGYPGIGGETITLTSGLVSGFVGEAGLGVRAWVKTDATIAGGNSGGLAADSSGLLVAVPTIASAGVDVGEIVDCRPVRDTNRDGQIDDDDDCVPLGGFLNGLRPIALAFDMVAAVEDGVAYVPIGPGETEVEPGDLDDVVWSDPVFGEGVTDDDLPIGEGIGFETGITSICAFFDYEGMKAGMRWSAEWSVDAGPERGRELRRRGLEPRRVRLFLGLRRRRLGPPPGLYDVAFVVEDEFQSGGFVHVGDDLATTAVTLGNESGDSVCLVFASPMVATVWGPDRLGPSDVLEPGEEITFEVIADEYERHREPTATPETIFEEPLDLSAGGSRVGPPRSGTELAGSTSGARNRAQRPRTCVSGDIRWSTDNADARLAATSPTTIEIVGVSFLMSVARPDTFPGRRRRCVSSRQDRCFTAFESFVRDSLRPVDLVRRSSLAPDGRDVGAGRSAGRLRAARGEQRPDHRLQGGERGVAPPVDRFS